MNKTFITHQEALSILEKNKKVFADTRAPLDCCGARFLAEDLIADRDFPPYDRVTMDGIAIRYDALSKGNLNFIIQEVAPAGTPQKTLIKPQHCIEVMTGAMLPQNTDTVIRYEDIKISDGIAALQNTDIKKAQNIHFKGSDIAQSTVIIPKGQQLSSAEINVAAAIGKSSLTIKKMPSAVIISTGDELVDVHEKPATHQIRRSNVYGIRNTLNQWGVSADLQHLPDEKKAMQAIVSDMLHQYDVLILTGGVSKGKFDYLPEILTSLKVKKHFHGIQQRPGKPIWFGTSENGKYIFALPGNPVSSFVCLYAYIRFWLKKSLGVEEKPHYATLTRDVHFEPNLIYFLEAKIQSHDDGKGYADPIIGNGSGDFINLIKTDGFLILPQTISMFKKGETYPFIPYRYEM